MTGLDSPTGEDFKCRNYITTAGMGIANASRSCYRPGVYVLEHRREENVSK